MIREKDIENYLVKQAKKAGFLIRKVQWVGTNHCPDRVVMSPGVTVWVELKAPGQLPRGGQLREINRMSEAGQLVAVLYSHVGIDELIDHMVRINEEHEAYKSGHIIQ